MKKQVSPVVTVVVILVVVIIVALLWNHFSGGGGGGSSSGDRGGFSIELDPTKVDMEVVRENAAKEREEMLDARRSGGAPGR
ncbi:MAG: hypothetical protein JSV65_16335 [Armatimonadota bacterium]|nr:MAG: hypothetical protein JSV65_16335 [Armatimonadota bacterium]